MIDLNSTKSILGNIWKIKSCNDRESLMISQRHNLPLFLGKLLSIRNIKDEEVLLNYDNLFSLNKGSQQDIIENNSNITYGFDYKINEKIDSKRFEKFSFSVGQVYNFSRNPEMPISSSLDRKSSDLVGKFNYNFRGIGGLSYNFGLAQDLNTLTYNKITGNLLFDKFYA